MIPFNFLSNLRNIILPKYCELGYTIESDYQNAQWQWQGCCLAALHYTWGVGLAGSLCVVGRQMYHGGTSNNCMLKVRQRNSSAQNPYHPDKCWSQLKLRWVRPAHYLDGIPPWNTMSENGGSENVPTSLSLPMHSWLSPLDWWLGWEGGGNHQHVCIFSWAIEGVICGYNNCCRWCPNYLLTNPASRSQHQQ